MIRKYLFVSSAIWFMVSFATPLSAQETWKADQELATSVDQWSKYIEKWLEKKDLQVDLSRLFDENFRQYLDFGRPPGEQTTPTPIPDQVQEGEQKTSNGSLAEYQPSEYEQEVVDLVNKERAKQDLDPLEMHNRLSGMAKVKSQDMADKEYFSHTSPTYGSPFDMMDQHDFSFRMAGENIAAGQRSPEQVVEGWMNSEGHRANILNESFSHIGVGYVEDSGKYRTYWTQLFMTPR